MNANEKAKEVCRKANLPESGVVYSLVYMALKEQDKDTRHACAEAVANISVHTSTAVLEDAMYHNRTNLIDRDKAHAACMNVKAV